VKHTLKEVELKGGLKGLLIDIPDSTVMYAELNVRAGEYMLDPQKWETAHLMEHVILGANEYYPSATMFQAEIEKNGAYTNASTGVYDITYEMECADFEWERVLDLELKAISKPLFLPDEFTAEFGNVQEELVGRSNNHFRALNIALRKEMGLCAMSDIERLQLMNSVTVEDVAAHYKKTHELANSRFIVAGKIGDREENLIQLINASLQLPDGVGRIEMPNEQAKAIDVPFLIPKAEVPNMYFFFDIYRSRPLVTEARDALMVAGTILTDTLFSRILGKARQEGLVYSMGSGQNPLKSAHGWWLGAQVSSKSAVKLFEIIQRELSIVLNGGVTDAEVFSARQHLLGKHQRSAQTPEGIATAVSQRYYLEDIIEDHDSIPARIESVNPELVTEAMRLMFAEKIWGFGLLGTIPEGLDQVLYTQLSELWKK
jgi:predicted Zn-dependent peptidase